MNPGANLSFANLSAILLCIAAVMAPHAPHVPGWAVAFCLAALLIRFVAGWQRRPLPSRPLLFAFAAVAIAGVVFSYGSIFGRDSAVTLLLAMTVLKLLEMHSQRDITITVVLCYFLAITNFFYNQTMFTAVYSLAAAWLITGTMVSLEHRAKPARFGQVLRTSGVLLAQSVPVMLILFVLFPRIEGPLWGLPRIQNSGRTGLSDSMAPGTLARLSLSDAIAFRVKFEGSNPDTKRLYWRGPVLWDYDGRTWTAGQQIILSSLRYENLGPTLSYEVTLEPHDQRWMFVVDLPSALPNKSALTRDYQVVSYAPIRQRLRYTAESNPQYRIGTDALPSELQRALALPPEAAPRTRGMVRQWLEDGLSPMDIVQRALSMYRDQPFIYTLEPPPLERDPVDQFLFETRRGFCEHFASSFAVMMRAAGVPTRVVTGYLGGEINPVDDYLIVRQSEAHAWDEVWTRESGWVRVDPTAVVSPLRIEGGLATALPETDSQPLMRRTQLKFLLELRDRWDAVTNAWNQWILGYTQERQSRFLSSFGFSNVSWQDMIITLMIATGVVVGTFAIAMFLRLQSKKADAVQRLWLRFCSAMAARGITRMASEGPRDFTERVARRFPAQRQRVQRIAELYIDLRYGSVTNDIDTNSPQIRELRQQIRSVYLGELANVRPA